MTILQLQTVPKPPRQARLVLEEQKLTRWYSSLDERAQVSWYTLHELKAATGIPMSRLPTVLRRLWWRTARSRTYHMVVWQGPNTGMYYETSTGTGEVEAYPEMRVP
jgi:hypothetical protein